MSAEFFDNVLYLAGPDGSGGVRGPAAAWDVWWRRQRGATEPLATAQGQGFVIGTGQLAGLGVSRSASRTAVRNGEWWRPTLGTIAPLRVADDAAAVDVVARRRHALICAAAVLRRGEHVAAGRSAAILHGLPTVRTPDAAELAAPNDDGLGRQGATHSFGAGLSRESVTTWFGVELTSAARTVVDLGRHDRLDAIMAADAALRDRLLTRAELEAELRRAVGWPGVKQARALLAMADPRAESPLEWLVRLALHDDGFPAAELQYWIGADRVDFCWPARRLVLEADGRGKYVAAALWEEKKRSVRLDRRGYRVERVLWSDLGSGWPAFSAAFRRLF